MVNNVKPFLVSQAAIKGEEWTPVEPKQESSGPTIIPEPRNPPPRRPHFPSNQLWDVLPRTLAKQNVCDTYTHDCIPFVANTETVDIFEILQAETGAISCELRNLFILCTWFAWAAYIWINQVRCCGGRMCVHAWVREWEQAGLCMIFYVHGVCMCTNQNKL